MFDYFFPQSIWWIKSWMDYFSCNSIMRVNIWEPQLWPDIRLHCSRDVIWVVCSTEGQDSETEGAFKLDFSWDMQLLTDQQTSIKGYLPELHCSARSWRLWRTQSSCFLQWRSRLFWCYTRSFLCPGMCLCPRMDNDYNSLKAIHANVLTR